MAMATDQRSATKVRLACMDYKLEGVAAWGILRTGIQISGTVTQSLASRGCGKFVESSARYIFEQMLGRRY